MLRTTIKQGMGKRNACMWERGCIFRQGGGCIMKVATEKKERVRKITIINPLSYKCKLDADSNSTQKLYANTGFSPFLSFHKIIKLPYYIGPKTSGKLKAF